MPVTVTMEAGKDSGSESETSARRHLLLASLPVELAVNLNVVPGACVDVDHLVKYRGRSF